MGMRFLILLAAVAANFVVGDTNEDIVDWVADCGSEVYIDSLEISNCSNETGVCNWNLGQTVDMSFLYERIPSMNSIDSFVYVFFMGQGYQMEILTQTPCVMGVCPLENDVTGPNSRYNLTFRFNFEIYSTVSVIVRTMYRPIRGSDQVTLSCIKFGADVNNA